jgi:PPE-repeat protein
MTDVTSGENYMHFAVLPPEVNSGRMYAGPGAGAMLAAAAAWDELANELHTTAANLESVSSGLTSEPWQGPAAASMAAAAAPQLEWLNTTAAQATQSSTQANAAVAGSRGQRCRVDVTHRDQSLGSEHRGDCGH